ncbi:MAG: isoleucine--tRNA ligase [Anaerolineae bacterium]|nr:isoleucine--tRNA ligase [Anaerolineae bacterium]
MKFRAVSSRVDIPKLEQEQLEFWREKEVFARTLREREGGPRYVFYEGPPTANGRPGIHHVLSRAFKDLFPRYKVMNGHYVLRKGGWDTHGLPVEIEVEKELGIKHKSEIEAFGIAEFNRRCRESVLRYVGDWEKLTERMGFWVSLEDAYITFKNEYIQSVWWILRQFWDKGLLFQDYKIVPYCARCGTPLSSHEISDYYRDVDDPSVFVRFKVKDEPDTSFLVWTTTPWTLPGNVALAVGRDVDYVLVEGPAQYAEGKTERLILAEALMGKALKNPEQYMVLRKMKGAELFGKHYEPLFTFLPVDKDYAYVVDGTGFVSTEDGSGIVHMAPAFGADDMEAGRANNLPTLMTVKPDGTFIDAVTDWAGQWVKDADPKIVRNLKDRHLLYRSDKYRHSYPFCWRCGTPLLYYARETWYIRTTQYRDLLLKLNDTINWVPDHIKDGRFGSWLANNRDWALGRERYWGTPLPVWVCDNPDCKHKHCIGSVEELSKETGKDQSALDLHRPYVDEVTWGCKVCGTGTMRRVPELIDVWFDSGAMPVAQWGYPFANQQMFEEQYPADYICEAIDQTRGWFYSLHAIATLLFEQVSYKNVICLGHILDGQGKKMSKSKGNIVNPWDMMNGPGADATRWYMYTASPPGDSRRFSADLVNEVVSGFYLMLWNTYSFFVTYANLDGFDPTQPAVPVADRAELDHWILAELHNLIRKVTEAYETYDVTQATRPIQAFVEDLSNWYLRRSRRRFWKTENDKDKVAAYQTLYECLATVAKLLAPTMPFLSEAMYRNLVTTFDASVPDSVHLSQWPKANPALIDQRLMDEMGLVKRLVSLGHAARNSVNLKVRQPLSEASFAVRTPAEAKALRALAGTVAEELNVKAVTVMDSAGDMIRYSLNPLPQKLGKRLGSNFPKVQKLLREGGQTEVNEWANLLLNGQNVEVPVNGQTIEVTPEEVEVRRNATEGYTVAEENGYVAALRTALTDALIMEGLAREAVRRVQLMRRDADYALNDHIVVTYKASDKLAQALTANAEYVRTETLADTLSVVDAPQGDKVESFEFDGETVTFGVMRA